MIDVEISNGHLRYQEDAIVGAVIRWLCERHTAVHFGRSAADVPAELERRISLAQQAARESRLDPDYIRAALSIFTVKT